MQGAVRVRWALTCGVAACALGCASAPNTSSGAGGATSSAGTATSASGSSTGGSSGTTNTGGSPTLGGSASGSAGAAPGGSGGSSAGGGNAGGSAGSGGAAGASAGTGSALDCTGRLVCDDFEKGVMGGKPGAPWKLSEQKGTVTLDDKRAVSGKYSVKLSITATASNDTSRTAFLSLSSAPLFPLVGNKVYGRFMIYTDRIPDKTVHWTFFHGDGPYADSGTTATYNYGGMGNLMANYYRDTMPEPTDCWQTKNESFPTGKWQCVGFFYDGPSNEMHFWMGPNEVPEVHVLGNQKTNATCTKPVPDGVWHAPTFKNISVGWQSYQHDVAGAHDAWIDDVVLDDEPIVCP